MGLQRGVVVGQISGGLGAATIDFGVHNYITIIWVSITINMMSITII